MKGFTVVFLLTLFNLFNRYLFIYVVFDNNDKCRVCTLNALNSPFKTNRLFFVVRFNLLLNYLRIQNGVGVLLALRCKISFSPDSAVNRGQPQ